MIESLSRRTLLLAAASLPFSFAWSAWAGDAKGSLAINERLAALESSTSGGRLGVVALNTAGGARLAYRAEERFAFCSTFKVMLVSGVLKRAAAERSLLERYIAYTKNDLVTYSPITEKHAGEGMSVSELCAAALQYGDNTAGNLLIRMLGGPAAVTAFARSIGDDKFRLDRWETALNTAIPGDERDTTTPLAMVASLRRLALGDALGARERAMLVGWMRGSKTGVARIRKGVPAEWAVADKTGTGDYGATNDIAIVWPPGEPPLVLVVYFTQREKNAGARDDVIAQAARIASETFG